MNKYKNVVETLVSAQEVIIKYSKSEIHNRVCWGTLFLLLGLLPPYTMIWLNVVMLIFAGIHYHAAVNEHKMYKTFKEDLVKLKGLEEKANEENV